MSRHCQPAGSARRWAAASSSRRPRSPACEPRPPCPAGTGSSPGRTRGARHLAVVGLAGLRRGEQGAFGGGVVAAAIFRHARASNRAATRRSCWPRRPCEPAPAPLRVPPCRWMAGCCTPWPRARPLQSVRLWRLLGCSLAGVLGQCEDPLPGGGEFLVLPEPRLEGGDLQEEQRVLRIGGGHGRQIRNRFARRPVDSRSNARKSARSRSAGPDRGRFPSGRTRSCRRRLTGGASPLGRPGLPARPRSAGSAPGSASVLRMAYAQARL